jgi:hypothetical protein
MSYEPASLFSPVENPFVVSQVARAMQPETKCAIAANTLSDPVITNKGLDTLIFFILVGGLAYFGYHAFKSFAEYSEKKKEKDRIAHRNS